MSIDRLSNMVSSIKNGAMAKKDFIEVPYSIECESIAKVLEQKGFLEGVKVFKKEKSNLKMIRLGFVKDGDEIKISEAKRVSKPGRRIYKGAKEFRPVLQGLGVLVVSTSRGIMAGEEARKKKLGGEVLCEVY